jgi:hypothetical protein
MTRPEPQQTRPIAAFDDRLFGIDLRRLDTALLVLTLGFIALVVAQTLLTVMQPTPLVVLRALHFQLSRYGLVMAIALFALAIFIGLVRRADVQRYFRRAAILLVAIMALEALIGFTQYFVYGLRPAQEIHILYGIASVAAVPFFMYVEVTARKRPAMGSYMWGFAILAGIILRTIATGPPG